MERGNGTSVILLAEADKPSPDPGTPPSQGPPTADAPPSPVPGAPPSKALPAEPIKSEDVSGGKAESPPTPGRKVAPYIPGGKFAPKIIEGEVVPYRGFPYPPRREATPSDLPARAGPLPQAPGRASGAGFLVKFNNADIYEVIHTLGRMAGINYLIDPRVRGVVNVHTQGRVKREGALELLFSILKINGATAVLEGGIYHIVPMAEAKMEPLLPEERKGKEGDTFPNRPVMRAFPLQYIAAAEMAKVIKPFISAGGDVTEVPRANMVLVVDTVANMEKHARLVELFDADAFRAAGVKMFPLKFLDPEEMAKTLESIFGALDFGAKGGKPSGINFVPLQRMNTLLVVTASPKTMENIERWISELDKEPSSTSRTVYLYRVRHGKVEDVMDILNRLFPGKTAVGAGKPTEFKPKVAEPAVRPAAAVARKKEQPAVVQKGGANESTGSFDIIPDEPTNSIIIRGSASEYAALLNVLKVIDIYPLQVLLEVLIAEVQLDDALRLGVDWEYMSQSKDWSHDVRVGIPTPPTAVSEGLIYAFEKTDRLMGSVRALADDGKVSILSSPSVISTNGKKSKIEVAQQVPVTTGQVTNVSGAADVITETVEYRDVGIILGFTPYINAEGLITLEIDQEQSEVSGVTGGTLNNPIFLKRSIQTTLLAPQDRSLVLGGLIQERRERSRDGIPFLYKIPVIGWLFGSRSASVSRTELLIFITPRVIESVEEGTQLSREFESRVEELKGRISESEGLKPLLRDPQREEDSP
ncbi:MAG: type II secretion system secretin GspD [Deltaproteobacteria bacterium]|nr:type II secretion system secretin GspD [Deltaproteobacteria bacterium]